MNSVLRFILILMTMMHTGIQHRAFSQHHDSTLTKQVAAVDSLKKSIPKEEHVKIGNAHIRINYNSPAVRGRIIWGGLVPYGEVWVTGAHKATSIDITRSIKIKNKEIPAGKYAIFTIPGKEKWTIIINKNWDQHLTDEYNEEEDLIRIDVIPQYLSNIEERLKYSIVAENGDAAIMSISWEKVKVTLQFDIE